MSWFGGCRGSIAVTIALNCVVLEVWVYSCRCIRLNSVILVVANAVCSELTRFRVDLSSGFWIKQDELE